MRLSILLLTLILFISSQAMADENKIEELSKYEFFGSRLAYAQHRMLARKSGKEIDKYDWRQLSGYGLQSDLNGGAYSSSRNRGGFDLYTGQAAVRRTLATDSIPSKSHGAERRNLSLADVTPVTVRSHPWDEMLQDRSPGPKLSSLFALAPEDCFVVYFQNGRKIGELENSLSALLEGAEPFLNFQQSLKATQVVAKRLGVENFRELEGLMGETLFISEDLDFYPNTHYALVFEVNDLAKIGANLLLEAEAQGRVGDAFVLASSKELFEKIRITHEKKLPSLADARDLQYCNAVLEKERDGFCYFSERFITKLVNPSYRINSSRRKATLEALVERQYAALAYHCLTNKWPSSFAQIVEEGYLPDHDDDSDFLIHQDGTVEHKVWGELQNVKPLSDVPIERISKGELAEYDRFRESYDKLWETFFDPVGIAFSVGEEVRFHTIVLPLVNSREYNLLQTISGGEPVDLSSLDPLHLNFPASMHFKFNIEDVLLMLNNGFRPETDDERRSKLKARMNAEARTFGGLDESFDLFSVFADELHLSFGPEISFDNFDNLDVLLSLKLMDVKGFRKLSAGLMVDGKREEKSELGVDYVKHTFGSDGMTVFAVYQDDYVHLTVYEPTFKRLRSGIAKRRKGADWFDSQWVGGHQNALVRADLEGDVSGLTQTLGSGGFFKVQSRLKHAIAYNHDYLLLAESAGPEVADKFFRYVPTSVSALPIRRSANGLLLGDVPLSKIVFKGSPWAKTTSSRDGEVELSEVFRTEKDQAILEKMELFETVSVGLEFTAEGLSTRVSLNNPNYEPTRDMPVVKGSTNTIGFVLGGGIVLLLMGWLGLRSRTKVKSDNV